jgi:hypothetical protein
MIEFRFNIRKFIRWKSSYNRRLDRAIQPALQAAGNKIRDLILDRSSRGIGLRGPFKSYTKGYASFRRKNGLGNTPDLRVSGDMLDGLDVKLKSLNRAVVYFANKKQMKKAKWNSKKRPFIGIKPVEKKLVAAAFTDKFRKKI